MLCGIFAPREKNRHRIKAKIGLSQVATDPESHANEHTFYSHQWARLRISGLAIAGELNPNECQPSACALLHNRRYREGELQSRRPESTKGTRM
jgi:hypothetical protein